MKIRDIVAEALRHDTRADREEKKQRTVAILKEEALTSVTLIVSRTNFPAASGNV